MRTGRPGATFAQYQAWKRNLQQLLVRISPARDYQYLRKLQ
jgi:hypothetical protein